MITSNVIQRTLFIEFKKKAASSFTVDYRDKQLLVTVRHLFVADKSAVPYPFTVENGDKIKFNVFHDNRWKEIEAFVHFHENMDIDIAVIQIPILLSPKHPLPLDSSGLAIGQDVFFLGFPFQLKGDSADINNMFPFPFVKKASFSALQKGQREEIIFYFDGHNNPGFSGGPIVFKMQNSNEFKICGVVRGYVPQKGEMSTPFGKASYTENSGIILSYNIKHCKEIIDKLTGVNKK